MIRDMFSTRLQRRLKGGLCMLALLAGAGSVHAADIYISAEFKPDINDPDKREFTNTTPWSGVCAGSHLQTCIRNNWWSIDTKIRGTKNAIAETNFGRNGFFIGMPSPKVVTVTSEDGAHSHDLRLNIIGAAMRLWDRENDGPVSPGPSNINNCNLGLHNIGAHNYSIMRMFLRRDDGEGAVECALQWLTTNNYEMNSFDFTYKLITPEPLKMRGGTYTGMTTFRVGGTGEGADFDLGNGVALQDNIIRVHFTLKVEHAFKLEVPPGSDRAVLAPKGGWAQWSDHGVAPKSLERELPFSVSSSGQFGVSLQCQHPLSDGRCAIRSVAGDAHEVALDVLLSMPGFRDSVSGGEAVDLSLTTAMAPPVFTADTFIVRRPSRLKFAVTGEAVTEMLDNPGSRYRGDVTVIFDAAP